MLSFHSRFVGYDGEERSKYMFTRNCMKSNKKRLNKGNVSWIQETNKEKHHWNVEYTFKTKLLVCLINMHVTTREEKTCSELFCLFATQRNPNIYTWSFNETSFFIKVIPGESKQQISKKNRDAMQHKMSCWLNFHLGNVTLHFLSSWAPQNV